MKQHRSDEFRLDEKKCPPRAQLVLEREFKMKKLLIDFVKSESGMQTGEYMVLGTVMAAGSIGAVKTVRDGMVDQFAGLTDGLDVDPVDGAEG
jgi:Flp pilus assembly pilin Flp